MENDVYVFGQFSNWDFQSQCKMNFDSTSNKYESTILLKNGGYDFSYALEKDNGVDEVFFQGSHSRTRNAYDILIYYRPFGKVYDKLIGYKRVD